MYKWYLSMLLLSFNAIADPFFGEAYIPQNEQIVEIESAKNLENLTVCKPSKNYISINLSVEFEKLKLIGLLKINSYFRALFIDEKDNIFEIKENELINNNQIEIKDINLKSITYINWKLTKDCQFPYEVTLKL